MQFYLLLIYYLLLLFLCVRNLKWGIYWIVFTLPVYLIRFEVLGLPMTVLEGQILVLVLVFLIKTLKHKNIFKELRIKNYELRSSLLLYYFITLLLVAATISIFISPHLRAAAGIWKAYFLEPILFFIVFILTLKKGDLSQVFKCLSVSVLSLSLFAIYQKFTGVFIPNEFWAQESTRRVTSVFPYPNALALYLAPLVVLFAGLLPTYFKKQETRNKKQISSNNQISKKQGFSALVIGNWDFFVSCFLFLVSFITGLLAIYYTRSKGALLAILAGIIFYAIFYKGYRKIFITILICVFVFLCFCVFVKGVPDLKGVATVEGGDSISTRVEMWQQSWQMLKTRPILGAGMAGYQTAVAPFHQKDYIEIYLYPHNIFLNFWSEIGLLGLVGFILIVIWFFRAGFKDTRYKIQDTNKSQVPNSKNYRLRVTSYKLRVTLMAAMTALLVHGLVDAPYFKNDLSVLFWLLVGAMAVLGNSTKFSNSSVHTNQHK